MSLPLFLGEDPSVFSHRTWAFSCALVTIGYCHSGNVSPQRDGEPLMVRCQVLFILTCSVLSRDWP